LESIAKKKALTHYFDAMYCKKKALTPQSSSSTRGQPSLRKTKK